MAGKHVWGNCMLVTPRKISWGTPAGQSNTSLQGGTILVNSLKPNCQNWIHTREAEWQYQFIYLNEAHSLLTNPREINTFCLLVFLFLSLSPFSSYILQALWTLKHNYFNVCFLSYSQTQSCLPGSVLGSLWSDCRCIECLK